MSLPDTAASWLHSREAAFDKLAEVAAVGKLTRELREQAGQTLKLALDLESLRSALGSAGGRISETVSPLLQKARPYADKAVEWAKANPGTAMVGGGALGGALLGGGSSLLQKDKKKRNVLGNAMTGAVAGAGVGGGAALIHHGLPGLQDFLKNKGRPSFLGPETAAAATPDLPKLPAGMTPEQIATKTKELSEATSPSLGTALHSAVQYPADLAKQNPLLAKFYGTTLGTDVSRSGLSALRAAGQSRGSPQISLNLEDFRRGLPKVSPVAGQPVPDKNLGQLPDEVAKALHGLKGDAGQLKQRLLDALAGKTWDTGGAKITPEHFGTVSHMGRPAERWMPLAGESYGEGALGRAGYRLNNGRVEPTPTGIKELLGKLRGGKAPARPLGVPPPSNGTPNLGPGKTDLLAPLKRLWANRPGVPGYDNLGWKGRMGLRGGAYTLPVLAPMLLQKYREGAAQKAKAQQIVQQLSGQPAG